jgi:GNAT superfamily N-acetyltransferase
LQPSILQFQPIDLAQHQELCLQFRADSFVCSFGSAERFYNEDGSGAAEYLHWLNRRMKEIPNSCVHVWQAGRIIGQLEMRRWKPDPEVGYVNLFYLIPKYRAQGLGQQLDQYAADFFAQLGCRAARLSASPTNGRAMRFYLKQGWVDLGPRADVPEVHYLQKTYRS